MLSSSTILQIQLDSMGSCTVQGQGIYLSLAGSLQPAFSSLDLHDAEISPLIKLLEGGYFLLPIGSIVFPLATSMLQIPVTGLFSQNIWFHYRAWYSLEP